MKLVASIITVTNRIEFYQWLEKLPWRITPEEKLLLADKAKTSTRVLWSVKTGFKFW